MHKKSGRSARRRKKQAGEQQVTPERVAYIKRKIGTFDILNEEGLCLIEENADKILSDVGMEFRDDPEILNLFKQAGADVQGERVRFEPGMCRKIVQKSAPSVYTQHARNPDNTVKIGGNNTVLSPVYGAPFVYDLDRGRRYATLEDFHEFDYVLAMDRENYEYLRSICPHALTYKIRLFMEFAPDYPNDEVPDPYFGGINGFDRVLDMIEDAAGGLVAEIRRRY